MLYPLSYGGSDAIGRAARLRFGQRPDRLAYILTEMIPALGCAERSIHFLSRFFRSERPILVSRKIPDQSRPFQSQDAGKSSVP